MIHRPLQNSESPYCNHELLVLLVQDQLDDERSGELACHLDHCVACRDQLNKMSFAETNWKETRTVILEEAHRKSSVTSHTKPPSQVSPEKISSLVRWLEPLDSERSTEDRGVADHVSSDRYIGQVDSYLVKRVIGYGGMGVVLEAWDTKLHRAVAIKAMHPHLAANGTARQRFVREARGAASVVHPNVVAIHTVHAEHDPPYFVMPLIAGESLQARIDRVGPLDIDAALRVAIQIADGLAAAHAQGLVHRDIKPANILVEYGTERALLTDFGVVRALNEATMTASGVIAGTPEYMSPEQAAGASIDTRSDLFSLGCVLYAMVSGRSPFRAETTWGVLRRIESDHPRRLSETRPEVSEAVESLVFWLLEKQPENRVESAAHLADYLRQLLAHHNDRHQHDIPVRLAKRVHRASKSRHLLRHLMIPLAIVGAIGLAAWGTFQWVSAVPSVREPSAETRGQSTQSKNATDAPLSLSELIDIEIQRLDQSTSELEAQIKPN
jgi:serine/threonine protein kinase